MCELSQPVRARGPVEDWLLAFEAAMRATVRDRLRATLHAHAATPHAQWVFMFPAQVCGAARVR